MLRADFIHTDPALSFHSPNSFDLNGAGSGSDHVQSSLHGTDGVGQATDPPDPHHSGADPEVHADPTPEPSSWVMLLTVIAGGGLLALRKNRQAS